MITLLLHLLRLFPFLCGGYRQLALENLASREQFAVYKRTVTRPKLRTTDRLWLTLARYTAPRALSHGVRPREASLRGRVRWLGPPRRPPGTCTNILTIKVD